MNGESLGSWLPILLVGVLTCMIPALTAPTVQFGVRIPVERAHAPVVLQQRRAYFWRSGILAAVLTAVAVGEPADPRWLTPVLVAAQLSGGLGCYFLARERILAVKHAEDWYRGLRQVVATDTTWRTEPERFPVMWLGPALAVIGATILVGALRYPHLPARLPVHVNAGGTVDRYADRTVWSAFAPVFAQVFVTVLIAGLLVLTYRSRPEVDAADPAGSTLRYRRFLAALGRGLLVLAALVDSSLLLGALQIWAVYRPSAARVALTVLPALLGVVVLVILSVRMGQAGSRLGGVSPQQGATVNRDDDRYWRGGLVYVNPRDPAVLVPKRFGVGWTLNLGNPWAWLVFLAITGGAVTLAVVRRG
jgi:uncharacterized membrane protein